MARPLTVPIHSQHVAVVGAGWAGLAAAIEATRHGHRVTLMDMAPRPGGRARSHPHGTHMLDNGQHILIGAYRDTLRLMREVGVVTDEALLRRPLALVTPRGEGLRLPTGPAVTAFARGVLSWQALPWPDRWRLLHLAAGWARRGFRCPPAWTVADLARNYPQRIFDALLDPLCVAALNTPAREASAQVLLTVLRDALFGGRGSADLLLPRQALSDLFPEPALAWLAARGARWQASRRANALQATAQGWLIDGDAFNHVILACSATEAARLLAPHAPAWAAVANRMNYQPIITVWLEAPQARWTDPMLSLTPHGHAPSPAQFGFDLGALGGPAGLYSLVISGAADWVAQGLDATAQAVLAQWHANFGASQPVRLVTVRADKRATFACTPQLQRTCARPLANLSVAGDHVEGPYPATLEGAVRSGLAAAQYIGQPMPT